MSRKQKLDVSEELTSTTGCHGRGLNRRLFSLWASTLPLSYPAPSLRAFFLCVWYFPCVVFSLILPSACVYFYLLSFPFMLSAVFTLSTAFSLYVVSFCVLFSLYAPSSLGAAYSDLLVFLRMLSSLSILSSPTVCW